MPSFRMLAPCFHSPARSACAGPVGVFKNSTARQRELAALRRFYPALCALISMTSITAIILEYRAETSPARRAPRHRALPALLLALLALLAPGAAAQRIGSQRSGGTLELPPLTGQHQGATSRATPVPMAPGQNVLIIPRASRDFVGEWGGHLRLTRALGEVPAANDAIVSLAFGESHDVVFMQTTAFAGRSSQIVQTSADVVNPKTIKLQLKGLETAFNPPIV